MDKHKPTGREIELGPLPEEPELPEAPGPRALVITAPLVVASDGSGDFLSLEEAVQKASPGATLYLRPGRYRLTNPLLIDRPLTLTGEGPDQTHVSGDGEGYVMKFAGGGLCGLSRLTVRHEGARWADCVLVSRGEVLFSHCQFAGAKRDLVGNRGGEGVLLYGAVKGLVEECEASDNEFVGLSVRDQAHPTIQGNTCTRNKEVGIIVADNAQPTLEGNTCQENKAAGIVYSNNAAGTARNNNCTGNGMVGIVVAYDAHPTLEGNE